MGKHMSAHLLEARYELVVYDVIEEALARIAGLGAGRGTSCKDVASRVDVVISGTGQCSRSRD